MKKAVISWGRFNPPTVGHEKLVQKVITVAKRERGEPRVYLTHTQNATKDPLSYRDKISFATKAFGSIVKVSASRTIIQLMVELQKAGFNEVVIVAGSDRVSEYNTLLNKYNGKDYTFDKVKVVSAGERDPDAEGVEGMSASKMRKAVSDGDMDAFMKGVPSKMSSTQAKKMYNMLRKGMLVEEIELFLEKNKKKADLDAADITKDELQKAVDELEEEDLEEELEEEHLDERAPMTLQQRLKRGRTMKRLAPRMQRLRKIKKFRMAPKEALEKRSKKAARNILRKKFAGKKGENYASLPASQKITVDKLIATKAGLIDRLSKRLMPMIRKGEIERIRQARSSRNESIENILQSVDVFFEDKNIPQEKEIVEQSTKATNIAKATELAREFQFKKQSEIRTESNRSTKSYKQMFGEGEATSVAKERIRREKEQDKQKHDRLLDRARSADTKTVNRKEDYEPTGKSRIALESKALKADCTFEEIRDVYYEGVEEWLINPTDSATAEQWGYARVNAFIVKEGLKNPKDNPCWDNYKPVGTKKKNGKTVPNCVPETKAAEEDVEPLDESLKIENGAGVGTFMTAADYGMKLQGAFEHHTSVYEEGGAGQEGTNKLKDKYKKDTPGELDEATLIDNFCECNDLYENLIITEAEYQGKSVKLNDPIRTSEVPTKKFKVYVKDPSSGNIKVVRFGDPNLSIKRDNPERRKSFRARHKCDSPGPITKARYWSCYQWRSGSKVDN